MTRALLGIGTTEESIIIESFAGQQTCLGKVALGPPAATFGNLELVVVPTMPHCAILAFRTFTDVASS